MTPLSSLTRRRIFGLDFLRAVAALMVVTAHAQYFFAFPRETAWLSSQLACLGVELFFVLSGYLIGKILLRDFSGYEGFQTVRHFWARRWFRTLPLYFLFLAVNLIFFRGGQKIPSLVFSFGTFTQNLLSKPDTSFFGESWSLSIEEWFYLALPLMITAVGARRRTRPAAVLAASSGLILLVIATKLGYALLHPLLEWRNGIQKTVILRGNAIAFGTVAAYLQLVYPAFWRSRRTQIAGMGMGVLGLAAFLMLAGEDKPDLWVRVFILDLASISFIGFLPVCEAWRPVFRRWHEAVAAIAACSYSLYLCNKPVGRIVNRIASHFGMSHGPGNWVMIAVYYAASIFVARALFTWFEKPILAFRDRRYPAGDRRPRAPQGESPRDLQGAA